MNAPKPCKCGGKARFWPGPIDVINGALTKYCAECRKCGVRLSRYWPREQVVDQWNKMQEAA